MNTTEMRTEYLTTAETAALIRAKLKRAFPGVPFSVRARRGDSVDVAYEGVDHFEPMPDGYRRKTVYKPGMPTKAEVEAVVHPYQGGGFDGMIDMAYDTTVLLDANGDVVGSRSTGTEGSRGTVPAWDSTDTYEAVTRAVRRVHAARYIFVEDDRGYLAFMKGDQS